MTDFVWKCHLLRLITDLPFSIGRTELLECLQKRLSILGIHQSSFLAEVDAGFLHFSISLFSLNLTSPFQIFSSIKFLLLEPLNKAKMSFLRAEEQGAKFWCLCCLSYIVAFSCLQ